MRSVCAFVGAVVLFLYLLAWLDLVDFYLCVGKRGSCIERTTSKRSALLATWTVEER